MAKKTFRVSKKIQPKQPPAGCSTPKQIAARLGVSAGAVREYVHRNIIKCERTLGGRMWIIDASVDEAVARANGGSPNA